MAGILTVHNNEVIGSYESQRLTVTITTPVASTTEDFTIPQMETITAIESILALDSNGQVKTADAIVLFAGNVLTITDGSTFDYSAMTSVTVVLIGKRLV